MTVLASTYYEQGRLVEAEVLWVTALEGMQRVLSRNHPEMLETMHNLASTYGHQGKLRDAKSLMEETVILNKQVIGESHVDTQRSVKDLEAIR